MLGTIRPDFSCSKIGGNGLTTLPSSAFTGLNQLTYLNLAANKFTSLPADVFSNMAKLTYLYVHHYFDIELLNTPLILTQYSINNFV
jgi:Leucine-rich repeat (LRR) protein